MTMSSCFIYRSEVRSFFFFSKSGQKRTRQGNAKQRINLEQPYAPGEWMKAIICMPLEKKVFLFLDPLFCRFLAGNWFRVTGPMPANFFLFSAPLPVDLTFSHVQKAYVLLIRWINTQLRKSLLGHLYTDNIKEMSQIHLLPNCL